MRDFLSTAWVDRHAPREARRKPNGPTHGTGDMVSHFGIADGYTGVTCCNTSQRHGIVEFRRLRWRFEFDFEFGTFVFFYLDRYRAHVVDGDRHVPCSAIAWSIECSTEASKVVRDQRLVSDFIAIDISKSYRHLVLGYGVVFVRFCVRKQAYPFVLNRLTGPINGPVREQYILHLDRWGLLSSIDVQRISYTQSIAIVFSQQQQRTILTAE